MFGGGREPAPQAALREAHARADLRDRDRVEMGVGVLHRRPARPGPRSSAATAALRVPTTRRRARPARRSRRRRPRRGRGPVDRPTGREHEHLAQQRSGREHAHAVVGTGHHRGIEEHGDRTDAVQRRAVRRGPRVSTWPAAAAAGGGWWPSRPRPRLRMRIRSGACRASANRWRRAGPVVPERARPHRRTGPHVDEAGGGRGGQIIGRTRRDGHGRNCNGGTDEHDSDATTTSSGNRSPSRSASSPANTPRSPAGSPRRSRGSSRSTPDMIMLDVACGAGHASRTGRAARAPGRRDRRHAGAPGAGRGADARTRVWRTSCSNRATRWSCRSSTARSTSSCAGARCTTSSTRNGPWPRWRECAGPAGASSSPTWSRRPPACATRSTSCTAASIRRTCARCSSTSSPPSSSSVGTVTYGDTNTIDLPIDLILTDAADRDTAMATLTRRHRPQHDRLRSAPRRRRRHGRIHRDRRARGATGMTRRGYAVRTPRRCSRTIIPPCDRPSRARPRSRPVRRSTTAR